jgi:uncharacterized protein (DUF1697 family)
VSEHERYAALLRGVNVGGKTLRMAALRELLGGLGLEGVATYVQSGNAVFRAPQGRSAALESDIESAIERELGLEVTVVVRTHAELAKIHAGNPFVEAGCEPSRLYLTFLAQEPDKERAAALAAEGSDEEELRLVGREIYLHYPGGYGRSRINNAFVERRLAVRATTRNWRTVGKLVELTGAL